MANFLRGTNNRKYNDDVGFLNDLACVGATIGLPIITGRKIAKTVKEKRELKNSKNKI